MADALIAKKAAQAVRCGADLQPWPGYYDFKARELETVLGFYDPGAVDSVLEIGCGNAFTACLLAGRAGRVSAFDLPAMDASSHSVGIASARELVRRMGEQNVGVVGGDAEYLPYADGAFDLIFSEYAIQYIGDKRRALAEMRRVLTPGGVLIAVVPNFMERVLTPLLRCQYLALRACGRIGAPRGTDANGASRGSASPGTGLKRAAVSSLAAYAALRADGAYGSYREELFRHTPGAWRRLFDQSGFRVVRTFTTQLVPLGLFAFMGAPSVRLLAGIVQGGTRWCGGAPAVRGMGYSLGLVAQKR